MSLAAKIKSAALRTRAATGILGAYLILHPSARIKTRLPLGIFWTVVHHPAWFFLIFWIGW
jgi:membrane associated rhomboid family serine protease